MPAEIVTFPKMCCGQPVTQEKTYSGSRDRCRKTGEPAIRCPGAMKFMPPIAFAVQFDPKEE